MPLQYRMTPHKLRPTPVRPIEITQFAAMRIRPPGSDKYRLHARILLQINGKPQSHRRVLYAREGKMVVFGRGGDEGFDAAEGVHGRDVDGGEKRGEVGVMGQEREIEDQEDEAVFTAIVGEGERWEAVHMELG